MAPFLGLNRLVGCQWVQDGIILQDVSSESDGLGGSSGNAHQMHNVITADGSYAVLMKKPANSNTLPTSIK